MCHGNARVPFLWSLYLFIILAFFSVTTRYSCILICIYGMTHIVNIVTVCKISLDLIRKMHIEKKRVYITYLLHTFKIRVLETQR